jgi:hypothetical protein
MLPTVVKVLFGVGAIGMFVGWSLFIRMVVELNRVLPPQKKFFILEFRMRHREIKRLHEKFFPVSSLRATWFAFIVSSVITMAAAIIVAVKPK